MRPVALAAWAGALLAALAAARAQDATSPVQTDIRYFDIFIGKQKVGHMRLKVMAVKDIVILDEDFFAPYKVRGKTEDAGFESQVVYKGEPRPAPVRGKLSTRLGTFKVMDGTFEMAAGAEQTTAKAQATGYADLERNLFDTPRTWEKDLPAPEGLLLTHAAMLHYAPRLLQAPGKIESVTHLKFPSDIGWPDVLAFEPDCVLERHPATLDGRIDITLHRVYAGGNIVPLLKMTMNDRGDLIEMAMGRFTIRPGSPLDSAEAPAPPAPAK